MHDSFVPKYCWPQFSAWLKQPVDLTHGPMLRCSGRVPGGHSGRSTNGRASARLNAIGRLVAGGRQGSVISTQYSVLGSFAERRAGCARSCPSTRLDEQNQRPTSGKTGQKWVTRLSLGGLEGVPEQEVPRSILIVKSDHGSQVTATLRPNTISRQVPTAVRFFSGVSGLKVVR